MLTFGTQCSPCSCGRHSACNMQQPAHSRQVTAEQLWLHFGVKKCTTCQQPCPFARIATVNDIQIHTRTPKPPRIQSLQVCKGLQQHKKHTCAAIDSCMVPTLAQQQDSAQHICCSEDPIKTAVSAEITDHPPKPLPMFSLAVQRTAGQSYILCSFSEVLLVSCCPVEPGCRPCQVIHVAVAGVKLATILGALLPVKAPMSVSKTARQVRHRGVEQMNNGTSFTLEPLQGAWNGDSRCWTTRPACPGIKLSPLRPAWCVRLTGLPLSKQWLSTALTELCTQNQYQMTARLVFRCTSAHLYMFFAALRHLAA